MGYQLVLLDFGMSIPIVEVEKHSENCIQMGTDVTMAPEQFMCNAPTGRGTDWWAFGASVWRIRVFWEPSISQEERDRILNSRCERWGHHDLPTMSFFSPDLQSLLKLLLVPSPEDRDFSASPEAFARLLTHPYFKAVVR
jgi:serine/threonine protein kinase